MFERVDPIFTNAHMKFSHVALSIGTEWDQAFAEYGIVPVTNECIVMPMLQRTGYGLVRLQLDMKPASIQADGCSP